jgi:hypothetical protein
MLSVPNLQRVAAFYRAERLGGEDRIIARIDKAMNVETA